MALKTGKKVEVLAIEEGCIGVWYKATVLENSDSHCLIKYKDIVTDNLDDNLIERVELQRVRPRPPPLKRASFYIGEKVDAKDRDGWWMGSVADIVGKNKYKVYFKQLGFAEEYHVSQLRPRQDWINEQWVHASKDLVEACIKKHTINRDIGTISSPCAKEKVVLCKTKLSHGKNVSQISQERCRQPKRHRETNSFGNCSSGITAGSQYDKLARQKVPADLESVKQNQTSLASGSEDEKIKSNINVDNAGSESSDELLETTVVKSILAFQSMIYKVTNADENCGSSAEETKMERLHILAYQSVLLAFHHQGVLDWEKLDMLANLRHHLNINNETHSLILKHLGSAGFD